MPLRLRDAEPAAQLSTAPRKFVTTRCEASLECGGEATALKAAADAAALQSGFAAPLDTFFRGTVLSVRSVGRTRRRGSPRSDHNSRPFWPGRRPEARPGTHGR